MSRGAAVAWARSRAAARAGVLAGIVAGVLAAAAAGARAAPCSAALCVEAVEVDGQRAAQAAGVAVQRPGEAEARRIGIAAGATFEDGTTIETPARPRVKLVLATRAGNAITLQPGAKLRVETTSPNGERFAQLLGEARFAVTRALGFFEVTHDRFLAAVKGTEFGVAVDTAASELRFEWVSGRVVVDRRLAVTVTEEDESADEAGAEPEGGTTLIARDVLSDKQRRLRYRLTPEEYVRTFRTYAAAEAFFRQQLAEDERSGDPERRITGLMYLARVQNQLGRPRVALDTLGQALQAARQARDLRAEAEIATRLGRTHLTLRQREPGVAMLQRAVDLYGQLHPNRPPPDALYIQILIGRQAALAGDAPAWLAAVDRVLEVQRRVDPDGTQPFTAFVHQIRARALWAGGRQAESLTATREALDLAQRLAGSRPSHDVATIWQELGERQLALGRAGPATESLRQSLDQFTRVHEGVHPTVGRAHFALARAHEAAGQTAAAVESARAGMAVMLQLFPDPLYPRHQPRYRYLAALLRAQGDSAAAAEWQRKADEIRDRRQRRRPGAGADDRP